MFVAQAHSVAQQARLAITLAWVAGYTNIISILVCNHVISHTSGTTSDLGRFTAEGNLAVAGFLLFLLLAFCFGAAVSGFQTEFGRRRGWESIYVLPMATEAVFLGVFALAIYLAPSSAPPRGASLYLMTGFAAAAMGLQNATITRISGGVVRTTHVTGVLTDLGMELAQFVLFVGDRRRQAARPELLVELRRHPTGQRLFLLASIIGSFALGAALGTLAHDLFPGLAHGAMFPPVLFLLWIIYQDIRRPIAEIEPVDSGIDPDLGLGSELTVFHLRHDRSRSGRVQRMPNLLAWSERLADSIRVAVLDLGRVTELDTNAAMEISSLVPRLRARNRRLVIAGLNSTDYDRLTQAARGGIDPRDLCPDVELAVARALNILHELHEAARTHPAASRV